MSQSLTPCMGLIATAELHVNGDRARHAVTSVDSDGLKSTLTRETRSRRCNAPRRCSRHPTWRRTVGDTVHARLMPTRKTRNERYEENQGKVWYNTLQKPRDAGPVSLRGRGRVDRARAVRRRARAIQGVERTRDVQGLREGLRAGQGRAVEVRRPARAAVRLSARHRRGRSRGVGTRVCRRDPGERGV